MECLETLIQIAGYALIPIIISLLFFAMKNQASKMQREMDINHFVIRPPRMILWIGVTTALLFSATFILLLIDPDLNNGRNSFTLIGYYLLDFGFILLGMVHICNYYMEKLRVNGEMIHCRRMFKKENSFRFDQLTHARLRPEVYGTEKLLLYNGKKKMFIAYSYCRGYHLLLERLKKENVNVTL